MAIAPQTKSLNICIQIWSFGDGRLAQGALPYLPLRKFFKRRRVSGRTTVQPAHSSSKMIEVESEFAGLRSHLRSLKEAPAWCRAAFMLATLDPGAHVLLRP